MTHAYGGHSSELLMPSSNEVRAVAAVAAVAPLEVDCRCDYRLTRDGFRAMVTFIGYIWTFPGELGRSPAAYIEEDAVWQHTMDLELPKELRR